MNNNNMADIVKQSFTQYAAAVIQSRALVDVRDGLKPSARQIFYCMDKYKYVAAKPFQKTMAAIGDAMKHFYIHGNESILRARPNALSQAGGDYDGDIYMREDDLMAAMANCYIARKTVHDTEAGESLSFQNDYMPEPSLRFGVPELVNYTNPTYMFRDAISPLPVFGLKKQFGTNDLMAQAYFADMKIDEQALNAACKHKVKKYCVGVNMDNIFLLGDDNHNDPEYYTRG